MATAPTPGLQDELDGKTSDPNVITLTIDGTDHTVNVGAFNALQAGKLRTVTGFTYLDFVDRCAPPQPFDLEAVAVFVWVAALQAGRIVDFAEVAEGITGDVMLTFVTDALAEVEAEVEEPGDPKG